jgi:hypothetical protein
MPERVDAVSTKRIEGPEAFGETRKWKAAGAGGVCTRPFLPGRAFGNGCVCPASNV